MYLEFVKWSEVTSSMILSISPLFGCSEEFLINKASVFATFSHDFSLILHMIGESGHTSTPHCQTWFVRHSQWIMLEAAIDDSSSPSSLYYCSHLVFWSEELRMKCLFTLHCLMCCEVDPGQYFLRVRADLVPRLVILLNNCNPDWPMMIIWFAKLGANARQRDLIMIHILKIILITTFA